MIRVLPDSITFSFPDIHPDASCSIHFQRTLRIPDDGKTHRLPPGLRRFPLRNVDSVPEEKRSEDFKTRGGVFFPMYQAEAMWIRFEARHVSDRGAAYPFAIKVAAGKRSAITAEPWTEGLVKGDYCILPKQPWLDGFAIEKGVVRQFVAAPLGLGTSVEEQITGKAEFGGLQLQVFPLKAAVFEAKYPKRRYDNFGGGGALEPFDLMRSSGTKSLGGSMGLGMGGKMEQTIYEDTFKLEDWETGTSDRLFVHIANSLLWRKLTGEEPPTAPVDANDYTKAGLPWFSYYAEGAAIGGGSDFNKVKPVHSFDGVVPDNEPLAVPAAQVVALKEDPTKVRSGQW